MTGFVLDASFSWPDLAAAKAVGYSGIIGYLSDNRDKNLTLARVKQARSLGMAVGVVAENGARDFATMTRQQATDFGVRCHTQKAALGFPADNPVYAGVDFGITPGDYPKAWANVQAFAVTAGGKPAIYGPAGFIDYCFARGAGYGWQAAAASWSGYKVSPNACLLQKVGKTLAKLPTGAYDENAILRADYGCWMPAPVAPVVTPTPTPTPAPAPTTRHSEEDDMALLVNASGDATIYVVPNDLSSKVALDYESYTALTATGSYKRVTLTPALVEAIPAAH